jgi:hypothetical protein
VLRCTVFGHRYRFSSDDRKMRWTCERCGAAGGEKRYGSAAEAARFASAFDREDSDEVGRRAPFLGMFPLRVWRRLRSGR